MLYLQLSVFLFPRFLLIFSPHASESHFLHSLIVDLCPLTQLHYTAQAAESPRPTHCSPLSLWRRVILRYTSLSALWLTGMCCRSWQPTVIAASLLHDLFICYHHLANTMPLQHSSLPQLNMVKAFDQARLRKVDTASSLQILWMLLSSLSEYISMSLYDIGQTINLVSKFRQCSRMLWNVTVWGKGLGIDIN